jgi:hypothetical protein
MFATTANRFLFSRRVTSCVRLLALALIAPTVALAQNASPALADEYARKAGLDKQLASLAKGAPEQFAVDLSGNPNMSPERRRRVIEAARSVFTAQRMGELMRLQLAANARETEMKQAIAFYDSVLGKRIVAAEAVHAAADPALLQKRAADLSPTFAIDQPTRYPLARRLESALRSTDFVLTTVEHFAVVALRGAAASTGTNRDSEIEIVRKQIHTDNEQLAPQLRPIVVASGSLIYETLRDEEFAAYVAYVESAAGKHISESVARSFEGVFRALGNELTRTLAAKS